MNIGGRPSTLSPAVPVRKVSFQARLAARYRELQAEFLERVQEVDGPYPASELVRHALEGSIKHLDAVILGEQVELQRPLAILEVGSFIGFSTRWLLECSRGTGARVVAVDPGIRHRIFDDPGALLRRFNAEFLPQRLVVRTGYFCQMISGDRYYDYEHYQPLVPRQEADRILASRPVLTAANLGEGKFDFIFIDGDHSAEAVLDNFTEALALLNAGGRIVFHDVLTWPEVGRALQIIADRYGHAGDVEILGQVTGPDCPEGSCDGVGVFKLR